MALDEAAARTLAEQVIEEGLATMPPQIAALINGDKREEMVVAVAKSYVRLFDALKTHAVVSPSGVPAMNVGGTPVAGVGKLT